MDQINILDPIQDMDTEIPQTFQGFIFRFIYKSPEGGVQALADKIYGQSKIIAMIGECSTLLLI